MLVPHTAAYKKRSGHEPMTRKRIQLRPGNGDSVDLVSSRCFPSPMSLQGRRRRAPTATSATASAEPTRCRCSYYLCRGPVRKRPYRCMIESPEPVRRSSPPCLVCPCSARAPCYSAALCACHRLDPGTYRTDSILLLSAHRFTTAVSCCCPHAPALPSRHHGPLSFQITADYHR